MGFKTPFSRLRQRISEIRDFALKVIPISQKWPSYTAVGAAGAIGTFWILPLPFVPLAGAALARLAFDRRETLTWGAFVGGIWGSLVWILAGFHILNPVDWLTLYNDWWANRQVSLWLPMLTLIGLSAWVALVKAGSAWVREKSSEIGVRRIFAPVLAWIFLAMAADVVVVETSFLFRSALFFGVILVAGFFERIRNVLRDDAKKAVVEEATRDIPIDPARADSRVSAIKTARRYDPDADPEMFQHGFSEERVVSIPVALVDTSVPEGSEEDLSDQETPAAIPEEPWPGSRMSLRDGVQQDQLQLMFQDDQEFDEDANEGEDPLGLLRGVWERNRPPVGQPVVPAVTVAAEPVVAPADSTDGVERPTVVDEAEAPLVLPDNLDADLSAPGVTEAVAEMVTIHVDDDIAEALGPGVLSTVTPAAVLTVEDEAGDMIEIGAPQVIDAPQEAEPEEAPVVVAEAPVAVPVPEPEDRAARAARSAATRLISVHLGLVSENRIADDFGRVIFPRVTPAIETALAEVEGGGDLLQDLERHREKLRVEADAAEAARLAVEAAAAEETPAPVEPETEAEAIQEEEEFELPTETPPAAVVELPAAETVDVPVAAAAATTEIEFEPPAEHTEISEQKDIGVMSVGAPDQHQVEEAVVAETSEPRRDADAAEMQRFAEWSSIAPFAHLEIERLLDERGRSLPDDQEIDFVLRRLSEYAPSQRTKVNLGNTLSPVIAKDEGPFGRDDVALAKGVLSLSKPIDLERWRFASPEQAFTKLMFFVFHDLTMNKLGQVERYVREGFADQADAVLARSMVPFVEELFAAFPERSSLGQEFLSQLDRAEFEFAFTSSQTSNDLLQEGLGARQSRSLEEAASVGRSRLLSSSLPPLAQEALGRFMKVAKLIDELDVLAREEAIRTSEALEQHALYPSLVELEYRALAAVRDLQSQIQKRPMLLQQIPTIIRGRDAQLAHLYERIERDAGAIEAQTLALRERQAHSSEIEAEVKQLKADVAERDERLALEEEKRRDQPVMDALDAAALRIAEVNPQFQVLQRRGQVKLKVDVDGREEIAVVFIHGNNTAWRVANGAFLETVNGTQRVDLIELWKNVQMSHDFDEDKTLRLRIVLESGELQGSRTEYVHLAAEVMGDPSRLLAPCDFDRIAATAREAA